MFIGRHKELNQLEKLYQSKNFECAVIYGRRRIGKTALINEFTKNKKTIHFQATRGTKQENLDSFSEAIQMLSYSNSDDRLFEPPSMYAYSSFRQAFFEIKRLAENERLVLVIDEYPFLAERDEGLSSLLQEMIDLHYKPQNNLMLILCGSSTSFMENQVLGYKSPLYGRRTAQFKLTSLSIWETKELFPDYNTHDLFTLYSVTNGIPMYLRYMDRNKTVDENIVNQFFTPSGYLFEEPHAFLLQELREPDRYNTIIFQIANGATKPNEIALKSGIVQTSLNKYLDVLIELDIIEREKPLLEKSKRKSLYKIKDSFFWFYFRFVRRYRAQIEKGNGAYMWSRLKPKLPEWMGYQFEQLVSEWCYKQNFTDTIPIEFMEIGRWWGNNPVVKQEEEIDLIAVNDNKEALFIECKYKKVTNVKTIEEELMRKSQLFKQYSDKYYMIAVKEIETIQRQTTFSQVITLEDIIKSN